MVRCGRRVGCKGKLFGVISKGGVPKIVDPAKFHNWAWCFWLTDSLRGTVLARPGFHLEVFGFLAIANFSYFNEFFPTYYELFDDDNGVASTIMESWASRLMVFVLTGFMFRLVTMYWVGTRQKAADLIRGIDKVVNTVSVTVDYSNPRADEFLASLHGAANAIGYYAFYTAAKNTKFKLSRDEMERLFEERGLESGPLLALHCKSAVTVLQRGILQTISAERLVEGGCMSRLDDISWMELRSDIVQFSGFAMSVMSSTSSNKLPFALFQLVNWATRLMIFFYLVTIYGNVASQIHRRNGGVLPFTCVGGTVDPHEGQPYCPTRFFVYFNIFNALTVYFVLGCLEMYWVLTKIWEQGLVLKNYLGVIDFICLPLREKPKSLREISLQKRSENGESSERTPPSSPRGSSPKSSATTSSAASPSTVK